MGFRPGVDEGAVLGENDPMTHPSFQRPSTGLAPEFLRDYVALPPEGDIRTLLSEEWERSLAVFGRLSEESLRHRYAEGKWSIAEILGHLIDCERIFSTRVLRIARRDPEDQRSFDQDLYVASGAFDDRSGPSLLAEASALRAANIALFSSFPPELFERSAIVSGERISIAVIIWAIAGHEIHHRRVIQERYL